MGRWSLCVELGAERLGEEGPLRVPIWSRQRPSFRSEEGTARRQIVPAWLSPVSQSVQFPKYSTSLMGSLTNESDTCLAARQAPDRPADRLCPHWTKAFYWRFMRHVLGALVIGPRSSPALLGCWWSSFEIAPITADACPSCDLDHTPPRPRQNSGRRRACILPNFALKSRSHCCPPLLASRQLHGPCCGPAYAVDMLRTFVHSAVLHLSRLSLGLFPPTIAPCLQSAFG
ncbi:hypothetical protein B0H63DRAFT_202582 [Podospora didyma]|uniref:Uncharacterized protein n=1 Tax=Podospora didyma TaxID=330526 RepID=A0AAE0NH69_9PEZI|nr:hypothetical protein B0H63DRAFT_202582 [Podospora didyma]